jgi:beta-N-acetylhexosaminidase
MAAPSAALAVLAAALAHAAPDASRPLRPEPLSRAPDEARVERVLASLDTRARAAQLLLAYPQLDSVGPVEVGGVLFVGNLLRSPAVARARIESARRRARVAPFFAVDIEGGPANRLRSVGAVRNLPTARELGELPDDAVRAWGRTVGRAMGELGLNLDLAPVLDVAPGGHMHRNGRSFSGDEAVVVARATAFARGLLEVGVVPIGKHFPGYGDLDQDSDHALVTADWPRERVLAQASVFARARAALGGVMLANVAYPAVDAAPAILSPRLVALVHDQAWLAVTDDLSIPLLARAIEGTPEDVLRRALLAGNDLLLTTAPPDWSRAGDPIGVLSRLAATDPAAAARIDEACRRVLRLKDRMGLLDGW